MPTPPTAESRPNAGCSGERTWWSCALGSPGLGALIALLTALLVACGVDGLEGDEVRVCIDDADCLPHQVCGADGVCLEQFALASDVGVPYAPVADAGNAIVDWERFGTVGAGDAVESTASGAFCTLDDVRADDLIGYHDDYFPAESLPESPWPDTAGRCGDDIETLSWRLMNCERMTRGLEPVSCDLRLVWAGRRHSVDMSRRGYFDHTDLDGGTAFDRLGDLGIVYTWAGENLAMFDDVISAHREWMRSVGHRMNILNDRYAYAGVGAVTAPSGVLYLTELFIRP